MNRNEIKRTAKIMVREALGDIIDAGITAEVDHKRQRKFHNQMQKRFWRRGDKGAKIAHTMAFLAHSKAERAHRLNNKYKWQYSRWANSLSKRTYRSFY